MWDWFSCFQSLRTKQVPFVLVTLISHSGSSPREPGARMIVLDSGEVYGTVGGGQLEKRAIEEGQRFLQYEKSVAEKLRFPLGAATGQCCGGVVELFFEKHGGGPRLILFGAGHVGQAVAQTLIGTPFSVSLVDERSEWINSPLLPSEVRKISLAWQDALEEIPWGPQTYGVVMTHDHERDFSILERLLQIDPDSQGFKYPTAFLGLIGSHSKWNRFKKMFEAREISEKVYSRIKCPIGLIQGGKAPREVAISLSAELLKLHYEKTHA